MTNADYSVYKAAVGLPTNSTADRGSYTLYYINREISGHYSTVVAVKNDAYQVSVDGGRISEGSFDGSIDYDFIEIWRGIGIPRGKSNFGDLSQIDWNIEASFEELPTTRIYITEDRHNHNHGLMPWNGDFHTALGEVLVSVDPRGFIRTYIIKELIDDRGK